MLFPVSKREIKRIIRTYKAKTSNVTYDNSIWLIKQYENELVRPLVALINASFESGEFPEVLIIAKVTPLFKKGESNDVNNYLPISLLPKFGNVEKIYKI